MIVVQDTATHVPDVSIIIPTYNRRPMLQEALATVLSQEFDGTVEIIVVDDQSQDGTSDFVRHRYPQVQVMQLEKNVGNYVARNVGLSHARGKYIAFLDDDDLWEPSYLRTQVKALDGRDQNFAVSGLILWDVKRDRKTTITQEPDLKRYTSPIHHLMIQNFIYTPSSVVFPRILFEEVGKFDPALRMGGDADLYIRCLLSDIHPIFTRLPVAIWRIHKQGKLTDIENFKRVKRTQRIDRYYDRVKAADIVPIKRIYAELDSHIATRYLFQGRIFKWLLLSLRCGLRGYPGLMLKNVARDVKRGTSALLTDF